MSSHEKSSSEKESKRKQKLSENHARAPWAASIVKQYREVFGEDQVIVLTIIEGDFRLEVGSPSSTSAQRKARGQGK